MGQSDVTDADVQLETYIRRQCLRHGTYSTEDVRSLLAAHRHSAVAAAVAKREAEIVQMAVDAQCGNAYIDIAMDKLIKKIQTGVGA